MGQIVYFLISIVLWTMNNIQILRQIQLMYIVVSSQILQQKDSLLNHHICFISIKNQSTMDIRDFQGITKYKAIVPTIYVCSWIAMLTGPVLFEKIYQQFCAVIVVFLAFKVFITFVIMIIATVKSHQVFKRVQKKSLDEDDSLRVQFDVNQQIYYGFIIPNYNEELQVLAETLDILAAHSRARDSYCIFLAMEAHEKNSDQKGNELIRRFQDKFKLVIFTMHQVREFEQKGKASNVSWCAEHLGPILQKNMISEESLFLTIIDADSWAPDIYFDLMEEYIINNYQKRHQLIFQPPQIFTRNHLQVPLTTRVYDMMHSFAHCSNLYSVFGITFPLSNYSLSYVLVKKIGFWDTCPDAIGEDFHTTQKAFWKTAGQIQCVPIYAPFNQMNIATGKGYKEDVIARFWQAQRHAQGIADVAWQCKQLFSNRFRPMNLVVFYQILETFSLPAIAPWVFISLMLQPLVLYAHTERPYYWLDAFSFSILFNILTFGGILGYLLLEIMKRRANKLLYKQENESILRIIEYPVFFIVNLWLISVPTFVIAAFNCLLGKTEYVVADKKQTNRKN